MSTERIKIFWNRAREWRWFGFFTYASTFPWIGSSFFQSFSTEWFLIVGAALLTHVFPLVWVGLTQRPFYLKVDWVPLDDEGVAWRRKSSGIVAMENGSGAIQVFFEVIEGAEDIEVSVDADTPYYASPNQPPAPLRWRDGTLLLEDGDLENREFYVKIELVQDSALAGGMDHEVYLQDERSGKELLRVPIN